MIERAHIQDRAIFSALWWDFARELEDGPSHVTATNAVHESHMALFDAVLDGSLPGVCLLARDQVSGAVLGGLLWAEVKLPWEEKLGRTVQGFGTYVKPTHRGMGICGSLWDCAELDLKSQGIQTILISPHVSSKNVLRGLHAHGYREHQIVVAKEI